MGAIATAIVLLRLSKEILELLPATIRAVRRVCVVVRTRYPEAHKRREIHSAKAELTAATNKLLDHAAKRKGRHHG